LRWGPETPRPLALVMAVILCVSALVFGYEVLWVPVAALEDVWRPENALVLDSAQIQGSPRAYLFWYDAGGFGYTVRLVSLGQVGHEHAVIQSHYITGLRWTSADTLTIELHRAEYTMLRGYPGVVVVPVVRRQP